MNVFSAIPAAEVDDGVTLARRYECLLASLCVARLMSDMFLNAKYYIVDCDVQNIVAHSEISLRENQFLNIQQMYEDMSMECTYQKNMFPGLIYRSKVLTISPQLYEAAAQLTLPILSNRRPPWCCCASTLARWSSQEARASGTSSGDGACSGRWLESTSSSEMKRQRGMVSEVVGSCIYVTERQRGREWV